MRTIWTFHSAGEVIFGRGAVGRVGAAAARLGGHRALVVTDAPLVQAGLLERVIDPLRASGLQVHIFDGGQPEPTTEVVERCLGFCEGKAVDLLVSLGGGSNHDLAKASAVVLSHGGKPLDYAGENKVPGPVLPHIAVSTTAGTGSEVSMASVLTDTAAGLKVGISSNYLRPSVAVFDPLLTITCPPRVTADAGMDALTHAIEAYTLVSYQDVPVPPEQDVVYQGKNPLTDPLALEAIRLVGTHLPDAVRDGQDIAAREGMHLAALLAGLAFSNAGVSAVHALEYPLGPLVHLSHGAGNGLLLPYVMEAGLHERERQLADVGRALGCEVDGGGAGELARAAIARVAELREQVGLPVRLRDTPLRREQLRDIAAKSAGIDRLMRYNPWLASEDRLLQVLESAW